MLGSTELLVLIVPVIIIAVIISVIRKRKNKDVIVRDDPKPNVSRIKAEQNNNSLDIIKERLAKGGISKEEYDTLKKEFE